MKIYCMRCEAENDEAAVVCGACGNPLRGKDEGGRMKDKGIGNVELLAHAVRRDKEVKAEEVRRLVADNATRRHLRWVEKSLGQLRVEGIGYTIIGVIVLVVSIAVAVSEESGWPLAVGGPVVIVCHGFGLLFNAAAGVWGALERIDAKLGRRQG